MSVTTAFAKQNAGARLTLSDDTETRVAIKHGRRTIAYVAIARDLWGQLLVDRFNCHEELVTALKTCVSALDQACPGALCAKAGHEAIAKATGEGSGPVWGYGS